MTMTSHEGTCKACGRFQGAALPCPYCGWVADDAALRRRLRLVAVGLALCGLALLYTMARLRPSEQVAIGSIGPRMQYASVRVCGTVTRKPYVSGHSNGVDYVSLLINDGSGSLRAMARGPVAGAIVEEVAEKTGRVPGVSTSHVELVWDPPWTPDRMTEAAKLELGLL